MADGPWRWSAGAVRWKCILSVLDGRLPPRPRRLRLLCVSQLDVARSRPLVFSSFKSFDFDRLQINRFHAVASANTGQLPSLINTNRRRYRDFNSAASPSDHQVRIGDCHFHCNMRSRNIVAAARSSPYDICRTSASIDFRRTSTPLPPHSTKLCLTYQATCLNHLCGVDDHSWMDLIDGNEVLPPPPPLWSFEQLHLSRSTATFSAITSPKSSFTDTSHRNVAHNYLDGRPAERH